MPKDSKKRILFINSFADIGGAERSLLLTLSGLDRSHFEILLACPGSGRLSEAVQALGVSMIPIYPFTLCGASGKLDVLIRYGLNFCQTVKLWLDLRNSRIDLIHCNGTDAHLYGALLGALVRAPVVLHFRDLVPLNRVEKMMLRIFKKNLFIVACSRTSFGFLKRSGVDVSCSAVVPNVVDVNIFNPEIRAANLRRDLNIPSEDFLVGCVGRIKIAKGCFEFVDAAGLLKKDRGISWIMVGAAIGSDETDTVDKLKEKARKLALQKFHLVEFRDDIANVMKSLDLLVIPSYREAVPLVVLEAMAVGTPVIGTNIEGIAEVIKDGINGLLIAAKDPQAVASAVSELKEDENLRRKLAQSGLRFVRKNFLLEKQITELEKIYQSLMPAHR